MPQCWTTHSKGRRSRRNGNNTKNSVSLSGEIFLLWPTSFLLKPLSSLSKYNNRNTLINILKEVFYNLVIFSENRDHFISFTFFLDNNMNKFFVFHDRTEL